MEADWTSERIATTLTMAADILDRDGWRRGSFNTHLRAPHCLIGAIRTTNEDEWVRNSAIEAIRAELGNNTEHTAEQALVLWNDSASDGCRDGRHAKQVLRRTARKLNAEAG